MFAQAAAMHAAALRLDVAPALIFGSQSQPPDFSGLDELLGELLPQLQQDGLVPGIFRTPGSKGTMPTPGLLRVDLADELRGHADDPHRKGPP